MRTCQVFAQTVTYDDILDKIWIADKKLHFKLSKSGQILCVHKTGFPRPGHICICRYICISYLTFAWVLNEGLFEVLNELNDTYTQLENMEITEKSLVKL